MTGFQRGDYIFNYQGRSLYLRLTLGALAEICARLNVRNIFELSKRIRDADRDNIVLIFRALSRPAQHEEPDFSDLNLHEAMPVLADVFETAFAPLNAGEDK